jgi:hypothetical protein
VSLNKNSTSINVGGSETLTATISPSNATNKNVTWYSSNGNIATVSSTGLVTAVAAGTATITVTTQDGSKTATCAVIATSGGGWGEDFGAWGQGNARGHIQSYPSNNAEAPAGVPWMWQFNAGDPSLQYNQVVWWGVNAGLGPNAPVGNNAAPLRSWMAQPRPQYQHLRPAFGTLGDSFERWRLARNVRTGLPNNHQENFPGGRMFFVPPEKYDKELVESGLIDPSGDGYYYYPGHYSSRVLFGVRADFERDRVTAYQDFYVQALANAAPIVSGTAVVATLALRGEADASPGDSAKIAIGGLTVSDQEFVTHGDVLTFVLDGVTYGNNPYSAVGGALDVTGQIAKFLARPYPIEGIGIDAAKTYDGPIYGNGVDADYYENGTGDRFTVGQNLYQHHRDGYNRRGNLNCSPTQNGTAVVLGPIEFVSVPKSSEIKRTPTDTVGVHQRGPDISLHGD